MGVPEVEAFVTHLAIKDDVAASTLFLYRHLLNQPLSESIFIISKAKTPPIGRRFCYAQLLSISGDSHHPQASRN
jgi:hypothetical protein